MICVGLALGVFVSDLEEVHVYPYAHYNDYLFTIMKPATALDKAIPFIQLFGISVVLFIIVGLKEIPARDVGRVGRGKGSKTLY